MHRLFNIIMKNTHTKFWQSSRYEGGGSTATESQQQPLMHPSLEDDQERRFEDSMKRIEVGLLPIADASYYIEFMLLSLIFLRANLKQLMLS